MAIGEPVNTQNPGVTPADVEACIASEHYFTAAEGAASKYLLSQEGVSDDPGEAPSEFSFGYLSLLTFCVLVTDNGHTVTGEAHCQDPARFSAEIGRTEARKDAVNKLWPMVVYAARDRLKPADPEAATDTQDAS